MRLFIAGVVILGLAVSSNVFADTIPVTNAQGFKVMRVYRADSGLTKAEGQLAEGKYMQALETLSLVLNRRPNDADALTYIGYAWFKLGNAEKAGKYFNYALKSDPKHLGANKYKADVFLKTGKIRRAMEQMQVLRYACGVTDCAELSELQNALNKVQMDKVQ